MAAAEDLDQYLRTQDFAVAATYNGATAVRVIHDRAFLAQQGIGGTNPVALGKASDFPAGDSIDKTLLIGAVTYVIKGREPVDDGAFVLLQLEEST